MNRAQFLRLAPYSLCALLRLPPDEILPLPDPYLYVVGNGVEDTKTLQSVFDQLNEKFALTGVEHTLVLKGTFKLTDTVYLRNKYRVTIVGLDCLILGGTLDCQGSTYLTLERVNITNSLALIYGRGVGGTGGSLHMVDCMIHGDIEIAQADTSVFDRVVVHGLTTLTSHHVGLFPASTCILTSWNDCYLQNVSIQGYVMNAVFRSCFFVGTITVEDNPQAGELNQVHGLTLDNCRLEEATKFISIKNTGGVNNLSVINGCSISYQCQTFIELDCPTPNKNWNLQPVIYGNLNMDMIALVRGSIIGLQNLSAGYTGSLGV